MSEIKQMTDAVDRVTPDERRAIEERLEQMKRSIKAHQQRERDFQSEHDGLMQALSTDEARWFDFNQRLEDLGAGSCGPEAIGRKLRSQHRGQLLSRRLGAGGVGDQLAARRADVAAARLAHRNADAAIGEDASEAVDAIVRRTLEGNPAASLSGSRLTFALMPESSLTSRRASSGVSFTSFSSTY